MKVIFEFRHFSESEAAHVAVVSGTGGVRGALARSGRGCAPPCTRQRENPVTMNQNSYGTWINKWGLARVITKVNKRIGKFEKVKEFWLAKKED